mgnify:CR=1 FL=1|tara:strand:+ start:567 stop:1511 length:945 start_codon:yes stop_codon:yes gene_type:complete
MITLALAGGVGGAKLASGLAQVLNPENLIIGVNTGDDFDHLGLRICPDLDTVMYTLAGIANPATGWGIQGETWNMMKALETMGGPAWFRLGDQDIATHIERTRLLKGGNSLSSITTKLSKKLGIKNQIMPVTNDRIETIVKTEEGNLAFQDYFVRRQCIPIVRGLKFKGASNATPSPKLRLAMLDQKIESVILCPSNPFLSIGPILAIPEIKAFLSRAEIPVWVVSPIIQGEALKGPAAKIMVELGMKASSLTVGLYYKDIATGIVLDKKDSSIASELENLGLKVFITETVMKSEWDRKRLAKEVVTVIRNESL